ncbi:MAG: glycosyltransferase family 2 protein [Candidatus Omnitrophica bacterium]|nr:glycosyltransferase family 2 protein [Candidatus Omnitrophota bacterium]
MKEKFSISFVLPMFNESQNIERTIGTIRNLASELTDEYEIVIVDDASTDAGARIVEVMKKNDPTVRLFCLKTNTKFGGAFAKGFEEAKKDVIVYMDSDMPVKLEDIKASVPLIADFDIVTGYSKVKKGDTFFRKIVSGTYNFLVESLFALDVKDINSGYKVVRNSVTEGIKFVSRSPFVDVELFMHAKRKNCTIHQYPLIFMPREGGKSHIARLPVILATFRDMLKIKLLSRKKTNS